MSISNVTVTLAVIGNFSVCEGELLIIVATTTSPNITTSTDELIVASFSL